MVLGIYWYFGFPEGLYSFDYFQWKPGYGGHANNPAELEAKVTCQNPETLIQDLKDLIHKLKQGFIYIYQNGKSLKIGTGGFNLHDFEFELMTQVEAILMQHEAWTIDKFQQEGSQLIKIHVKKEASPLPYPALKLLKLVSSNQKKHNAETSSLRLDCNIAFKQKDKFLSELNNISTEENINVLFYLDKAFEDTVNLMLFFSNGRQGCNLKEKQMVDAESLERKIIALCAQFNMEFQHKGGWDFYPKGDYKIVKIVDEDLIIDKR